MPQGMGLPRQLRQLGHVGGDVPGLFAGEQLGRRPSSRLVLQPSIGYIRPKNAWRGCAAVREIADWLEKLGMWSTWSDLPRTRSMFRCFAISLPQGYWSRARASTKDAGGDSRACRCRADISAARNNRAQIIERWRRAIRPQPEAWDNMADEDNRRPIHATPAYPASVA